MDKGLENGNVPIRFHSMRPDPTRHIQNVEYLISAMSARQFPKDDLPELAISGRSNVGKSSLLNLLVGRKAVAKVSRTPGKTRAVNFFDIDGQWRLVDLPGYGYARLSKKEIEKWGKVIDRYLRERPNLAGVIQLIDSRHDPTRLDREMMAWLAQAKIPTLVALTKTDKIGRNQLRALVATYREKWIEDPDWKIVATSAEKKEGREDLLEGVERFLSAHQKRSIRRAAEAKVERKT